MSRNQHRPRIVIWLAVLLVAALTARLGFWQLDRADQKRRAHASLIARGHLAPWLNADWPCTAHIEEGSASLPLYQPARLTGRWLSDRTVFLDNRPMDGRPGYLVVTPLRLSGEAGACGGQVVLVVRGWLPRLADDRQRLPAWQDDTPMDVSVPGRLLGGLPRTYQLGQDPAPEQRAGPLLRQNADALFWHHWLGQVPVAGALQQVQAESSAVQATALLRHWPEPDSGVDKHLAYAAQWFALSALTIGLTLWFQVFRHRLVRVHVPS